MQEDDFSGNSEKLLKFYKSRNVALRNEIVLDNQRLVWHIVQRYTSAAATREDMFQAGILGLITAIERFDPGRGTQLSTYAVPYIQNEIRGLIDNPDYIDDHEGLEPVDIHEDNLFRTKLDELYQIVLTDSERTVIDIVLRTSDEPAWSINDISKRLKISNKEVRELYASGIEKLNRPWVRWYVRRLEEEFLGG